MRGQPDRRCTGVFGLFRVPPEISRGPGVPSSSWGAPGTTSTCSGTEQAAVCGLGGAASARASGRPP
eukprot:7101340-Pyramimonas_sp.AAC.1